MSVTFKPRVHPRWSVLLVVTGAMVLSDVRATAPPGRYTYPDGTVSTAMTVTDTVTGLTWQRTAPTMTYDWDDGLSYCSSLSLGNLSSGWRLPQVKELISIVDYSTDVPSIDSTAFPSTTSGEFWTNELSANANESGYWWEVNFDYGVQGTEAPQTLLSVRCVNGP